MIWGYHYFRKHPNTSWGERCLIGMFFGVQIPPKTQVFGSLGLVSFWKLCGNFWQKKHQNKKTEDIFNPGKFDLKNTPWVNNKQTFGNNIQGGLYLLIPRTSVFFCVLGRWTEDSVRAWSQDAFPPLSLVMLRLLVGCGGLLLAYLGAKAFLHFRELRKEDDISDRWYLLIFQDVSKFWDSKPTPKPNQNPWW